MPEHSIYSDIAGRCGGDIYIGVVGPVRTGKSTLIKRFMETLVLPNIADGYDRDRARDEMPQSAAGKTVMTTEPKFVPDRAVGVKLDGVVSLNVRMVDCVGYLIPDVLGSEEDGKVRMVHTPWDEEPMPFADAAELGTRRVIHEHSTIGLLVTTDGTIGEIPRASYTEAEERIVRELKAIGKPFAIILNSADPGSEASTALAYELEEKYGVPVALVSCLDLDGEDIRHILELVLYEFPVRSLTLRLPEWTEALDARHRVRASLKKKFADCAEKIVKVGNVKEAVPVFTKEDDGIVESAELSSLDLATGDAEITLSLVPGLYYDVISELTGLPIRDEEELIRMLKDLAATKAAYDKVAEALRETEEKGYGIVMPSVEDLRLEEPEIVRQNGAYGVRLRAGAQSIHMIRAHIETEINPIVGTEQQSEDLVRYMLHEFEADPARIWESDMFGKRLYELVNEGLHAKLGHMPEEARAKLSDTLEKIINEGSNGLICILL